MPKYSIFSRFLPHPFPHRLLFNLPWNAVCLLPDQGRSESLWLNHWMSVETLNILIRFCFTFCSSVKLISRRVLRAHNNFVLLQEMTYFYKCTPHTRYLPMVCSKIWEYSVETKEESGWSHEAFVQW